MNPSETYITKYDEVKWGEGTKKPTEVLKQKLDNHYIIKF